MFYRLRQTPLIGITLMITLMAVVMFRIDWSRFKTLAVTLDPLFLAAAIVMFILQLVFLVCRWHILINVNRHYIKHAQSARIFCVANATNFIFLTSLSGMIVRFILSIRAGSPWLNALCASVMDRLFSLGILLAFAVVTLPATLRALDHIEASQSIAELIGALFFVSFFAVIYLLWNPTPIKNMVGQRRFRVGRAYLLRLLRSSSLPLALLYSFAAQSSFFLGVYFILCAGHVSISFFNMMIILPTLAVLASLPLTIGGWGLREGVYVVGFGLLNVSIENAFLASVQVGLLTMISSFLMATPALLSRRLYTDLRPDLHIGETIRAFLNKT